MSNRDAGTFIPSGREPRLQFSLLTLLLFTTAACLLLAWWAWPRAVDVIALFNVSSQPNHLTGSVNKVQDYEIVQRTQLAYLKSVSVLQAAVSDPRVAKLPMVVNEADPVAWLQQELRAQFQQNSEILSVRIAAPSNRAAQAQILLTAVVKAYLQAVTAEEQQRLQRQLQEQQAEYDALYAQIEELSKTIAIARSQRGADDPVAKLMQLEADRHVEQAGKLKADLDVGKSLQSGPPRVRLIQPATVVK